MKASKHILFRLLFLTAVLFCLGLEVYSYYSSPICNKELSSELNCQDKNVSYCVDSFEDDHINQVYEPTCFVAQQVPITSINDSFLLFEFSFSNWQPPKFS